MGSVCGIINKLCNKTNTSSVKADDVVDVPISPFSSAINNVNISRRAYKVANALSLRDFSAKNATRVKAINDGKSNGVETGKFDPAAGWIIK